MLPVIRLIAAVGVLRVSMGLASSHGHIGSFTRLDDIVFLAILLVACFARIKESIRFVVLESFLFAASCNVVLTYGMSAGVTVLLALFILIAAVCYDLTGGILAGLCSLALVAFGGWGWTSGHLPLDGSLPQEPPAQSAFWIHALISQFTAVCGLTWIISYYTKEMRALISQLRLAEEKFSKAFRISPDAMVISELSTRKILEVNDSHERLTGFSREEVVGKTAASIGILKKASDSELLAAPLRETGSVRNIELQIRHRSGRDLDVVYSAEAFDLAGTPFSAAVIQDITERKKTEAALVANEERFRSFIDNANVGIYRSTPEGKILMVNPALLRIMGYPSFEEMEVHNLESDRYEPSYTRKEFREMLERTGALKGWEALWTRRDGSKIYVRESASVIRGADGKVLYYDGIIEDISERKKAEQALRESEERFRNLTAAAFEGIFITENGRIVDVNDQGLSMLGYARQEMIGREVVEFIAPESREMVAEAISAGREMTYKHQMLRKDGSSFQAEAQAKMTRLGSKVLRMTALRDITERIRTAERQSNLEEQLRQLQKMEALGTLAGGIAHDFNNILTGILANLQLAEMDLEGEHPAAASVRSANQASIRARDLVARILAFSRLEKDKRSAASLRPIVLEAVQLLRVGLAPNIEITTHVDSNCPNVVCDSGQIHQVIMNLGTNAIHAMSESGGTLAVELREVTPDGALLEAHPQLSAGHTVRLSLRDTGCGMDAEVKKRLFEPFFTTKTYGKGTGLGLSMVHAIVKSHGGTITVDSAPGSGTCFNLYFLAAVDVGARKDAADALALPRGALGPVGHGRKVLLVDDEEVIRAIGSNLLRRFGFEPAVYSRPAEALEAFRAAPASYSLVISDLTMPEMTGLELARHILALGPLTPIILTSGYFHQDALKKAHDTGVRGILTKPFEVMELVEQIRLVLEAAPRAGA